MTRSSRSSRGERRERLLHPRDRPFLHAEFQVYGSSCSYAWNHKRSNELLIGWRDKPNETLIESSVLQDPVTAAYASLPAGHPMGYHDAVLNLFKDYR